MHLLAGVHRAVKDVDVALDAGGCVSGALARSLSSTMLIVTGVADENEEEEGASGRGDLNDEGHRRPEQLDAERGPLDYAAVANKR